MEGLEAYKTRYEDFTLTFEREGRVSGVSGLETGNLDRWLAQTKEFQRAADSVLKALENDRVLVSQERILSWIIRLQSLSILIRDSMLQR